MPPPDTLPAYTPTAKANISTHSPVNARCFVFHDLAAVVVEDGLRVDKDVKLMRDYFGLEDSFADMSPLVIPPGYTKSYLDGKVKVRLCFAG